MTTSAHHTRIQVGGVTVDPTNVRLDLDENRVPFALSTIEAAYDPDLVDQLDPRNRVPVHVSMRQSFGTSRTLADVSADYAGMVLDDMGALSDTLNDNPSMEDGTTGWAGLNGTTAVQTSDQARTGTYSLEVIPPPPTPPVNLLTSTQARCSSTDGWGAIEGCTRSVTSAQAAEGSTSIAVTSGGARIGANTSPLKTQVAEGTQYTAVAEVRAATSGRTVRPYIVWQTSSGVTITSVLGSVAGDGTSSWTPVSVTGTAPAGAALAYLEITFGDAVTPAGEVHYIDKAGFFEGTNTAWVAPPPTLRFVDLVSDPFAVSQGSLFFCRAWARLSGATNTRAVSLDVEYLDEADNIMDSDSFGATLLDSTDGWVPLVGTALVSDNPDVVAARIVLSASIDPSNQRLFFDDVIMRYARSTLASFTAEYGEPYNSGGWRPSTKVRAALWLRNRTVDHEAGTVTIEAASADAALTDYSLTSRTVLTPSGSTVRDCVNLVLGHTLNAALPAGDTGSQTVEADALRGSRARPAGSTCRRSSARSGCGSGATRSACGTSKTRRPSSRRVSGTHRWTTPRSSRTPSRATRATGPTARSSPTSGMTATA